MTKCAEDRETTLKLKLEQETERLRKAQKTLNEKAKDRAERAREAFGTAVNTLDMRSAQRHVETLLRALSMNKSAMERLRDRKSRPNRPGLTGVVCPPDRQAHNDYMAKVRDVCVCVCVCALARACTNE